MEIAPRAIGEGEWTTLVDGLEDLSLLQTWAYGEAKAASGGWRVERLVFTEGGAPVGAAQVMLRPLPVVGGGLAWLNRGPLSCRPQSLTAMLAALRHHYLRRRFYLRIRPALAADIPLASPGFSATGQPGWASAVVDLALPEDDLRRRLAQKWRNVLNKAERQGLGVEVGAGAAPFAAFLQAHRRFLAERGFTTSLSPELLAALQERLPEARRMLACLARDAQGEVIAGVLVARFGATAEYLAGNLSEAGRRTGAGQLLLWRAMMQARAEGARRFDLGGMDERLTPSGIYRFKAEVGGTPYRLADEVEACPWDPLARLVRWRVGRALAAMEG